MNRVLSGTKQFLKSSAEAVRVFAVEYGLGKWAIFCVLGLSLAVTGYSLVNLSTGTVVATVEDELTVARRVSYRALTDELQVQASKFRGKAGIIVKDLRTGESVGINSSKLFPSASLVKLPIMAAVYQAQEEGKLQLSDKIKLLTKHKVRDSSRLYFVRSGNKIEVRDLIERMITESDNTATNMLVDALGFGYLNQKFVDFGLKDTDLRRGVMDLKWRNRGIENYTTAEDMAYLLEKIYQKELVSEKASREMMAVLKRQKVNDRIPRGLPRDLEVAHKTGLLRNTVSDVGIVFTKEGDFIICVLTLDIKNYKSAKRFIGSVASSAYGRCYLPVETATSKI